MANRKMFGIIVSIELDEMQLIGKQVQGDEAADNLIKANGTSDTA